MKVIGDTLKEAREQIGISIEEASSDLKIRPSQLQEIENGDFKSFKDIFYLKNFIKEYAKYLGLDPIAIIDDFNEFLFDYTSKIPMDKIEEAIKTSEKEKKNEISSPYTKIKKPKKKIPILLVGIFVLIGILVLFIIYFIVQQINVKKDAEEISYNIIYEEGETNELA